MHINKYFPFAFVYFFINSLGLPYGLTYMAVLSPLLYAWVVLTRRQEIAWPFVLAVLPVVCIHFAIGVDAKSYFVSLLNMATVYVFCQAVYTFLKVCRDTGNIFRALLLINFVFCLIAIPFYFTPYYDWFWANQFLTEGVYDFKRLSLFTYEPSYYALLFTPLFGFFFWQIVFKQNTIALVWLLPMLFLPFILSFSLGVITTLIIALVLTCMVHIRTLIKYKRFWHMTAWAGIAAVLALTLAAVFFPDNILFTRLYNVFSGKDPSAKGRTFEAFWLAGQLLAQKSHWWGIGLGQIKVLGFDLIRDYYGYGRDTTRVAIPNAAAETLAIFGWVGLSIRILAEWFLFIYTKVWTNYYRLLLFLFIFIYQFTGSFISNVAEYVIWVIAFSGVFKQFEVQSVSQIRKRRDTVTLVR